MSTIPSSTRSRLTTHNVVGPIYRTKSAELLKPSSYFQRKAYFDRFVAVLLLPPCAIVIGLLVVLVRLTSHGPGIYRQVRIGQHGRKFMMYKIRTMRQDAECSSGPVWTQPNDPRTTMIGRILRWLHLDELPQLLNILKGEMSLVGPRPERPEFVHVLAEAVPGYMNRLVIPPGITGLAQLNLPPDSDLTSVQRKLVLDCEYAERANLWLDIRLFLCTVFRVVKLPEPWLLVLFGLYRKVRLAPADDRAPSVGMTRITATPASIRAELGGPSCDGDEDEAGPASHNEAKPRVKRRCRQRGHARPR
jgi:lipopolysaccharide/colanic/teichoic acid biosynthesis glycosyltransferase